MAVRFFRPVLSITYCWLPLNISSIAWGLVLEDVHASPLLLLNFAKYFVDGLKYGEIQKAVRLADVQDLKSALLYALQLQAATQASRRDCHSIRTARITADEPCESRCIKEIEKLKEEMQALMAQRQKQEKRNFKCWGCSGTGHLRRICPRSRKEENTASSSKQEN
ncbi:uncharacterized protein TNCV_4493411 [Trichonephila clavipes]|uniref:CCHC-type domain-containing protein n=1 Tax=Trichonephila clavipes TaxID=2585209 RepID=A0A8X6SPA6_TRICX|nr:uncharacterized protein TNCV_4493411 [Trichonephila clavipes]